MKANFEIVNIKEQLNSLKTFRLRIFRRAVQIEFAKYLATVKYNSPSAMRQGPRGVSLNESVRRMPPVAGVLTSRSRRLEWMLREEGKDGFRWVGIGTKRMTTDSNVSKSFFGKIIEKGGTLEGSWSVYIRPGSVGYKNFKGRAKVSDQAYSLQQRALWEKKGRPFIAPTAQKYLSGLKTNILKSIDASKPQWQK